MRFADGIRKPGEQTRLIITAAPGSLVAVAAVDKSVHLLKGGNELTVDDVRFFFVEVQCYITSQQASISLGLKCVFSFGGTCVQVPSFPQWYIFFGLVSLSPNQTPNMKGLEWT